MNWGWQDLKWGFKFKKIIILRQFWTAQEVEVTSINFLVDIHTHSNFDTEMDGLSKACLLFPQSLIVSYTPWFWSYLQNEGSG